MGLLIYFREQPLVPLNCTWKTLHWHRKSMSAWVCAWPLANTWGTGHGKSDSHWLLCRRKAKHNLPLGLHAILFFREMWLYLSWVQRLSLGRTAKWLWSQSPQIQLSSFVDVCTGMCTQVMMHWKSAGNFRRGSWTWDHTWEGHMFIWKVGSRWWGDSTTPHGNNKSRRIRAALAFSHRDWAWRSSSNVGTGVLGREFGQMRERSK